MKLPGIDKRNSKDILDYIKEVAPYYIPEWKIDEKNSDFGWTFAVIFSKMLEETISRLNQVPYNNYLAFLNLLDAELLPSASSQGYITIGVVHGADSGVYIKQGTQLYAASDNEDSKIIFETQDDIYAVDNQFSCIYCTSSQKDKIVKLYDADVNKAGSFKAFDFSSYENLQKHELYISDNEVLNIGTNSTVIIEFENKNRRHREKFSARVLCDPIYTTWAYLSESGWKPIKNILCQDNKLVLSIDGKLAQKDIEGIKGRWISCSINNMDRDTNVLVTDIRVSSRGEGIKPDHILNNDLLLANEEFLPYGENLSIYDDFYISSEEAFSKKGAVITLKIDLTKKEFPIEAVDISELVKYKPIMDESDFLVQKSYDITIGKVIWEYWNGNGWTRLFVNEEYERIFCAGEDKNAAITFICPKDIEATYAGAHLGYFIRARIAKINNAYKTSGNYICPYISSIAIDYNYKGQSKSPDTIIVNNNMESDIINGFSGDEITLFNYMESPEPSLYLGMENPIISGPVKIFFDIDSDGKSSMPPLKWQFFGTINGQTKWHELNVFDGTNNFSHSGIVTLIGRKSFSKLKIFDTEKYWIRLVNSGCEYDYIESSELFPMINNMHFNTVKIFQQETQTVEYFYIDNQEQDKLCQLSKTNLVQAEVWVNEYGHISITDMEKMQYSNDFYTEIEKDEDGSISGFWIKWHPVEDFRLEDYNSRCYKTDSSMGRIIFGNGINGKIPTHQTSESIKVIYKTGRGKIGNVASGQIASFADSIPFISHVYNFKSLYGGLDRETVDKAIGRCSNNIKHLEAAVSLDDYEKIIHDFSRNIARVKCLPHINSNAERDMGSLTVVILPADYNAGYDNFLCIKEQVSKELNKRASALITQSGKLYITQVKYIRISTQIKAVISDYNKYQQVYRDIENELHKYLNPIHGNNDGKGWEIGKLPNREKVYNFIKSVHKIKKVKRVNIFTYEWTTQGYKEISFDSINNHPFVVPVSGQHDIDIEIE